VLQTDHQHTSQQALQWDVAGYKKGPDTRKKQVNEDQNVEAYSRDLQTMELTAEAAAFDRP